MRTGVGVAVAHADNIGGSMETLSVILRREHKTSDRGSHDVGKECRYPDDRKSFWLNIGGLPRR